MKTLFVFDDHAIPFRSNVDLTLLQGVKYSGNPVLRRGKPGEPDARWARLWGGTVLRDKGKFRMWYSGAGSVQEWMLMTFKMLYAESDDGIHWVKPDLSLAEYNGSKSNNIVNIEYPVEMPAVMIDEGEDIPAEERYKMFSENLKGEKSLPFVAVSPDGIHWEVVAHPKHRGVALYKFNGYYHSSFVLYTPELPGGYPGGRVMGTIRSRDYKNWTGEPCVAFHRANYFMNPPDISEQVHTPAGFWNRGNVILGVYGQIHQIEAKTGTKFARAGSGMEDTTEDLGLILSNDGIHFREAIPGFKFVGRGEKGEWDGGSLVPANSFVNTGDFTYLYYGAWQNGMCFDNSAGDVGLAYWRRDSFGYVRIRNADESAVIQTEAIEATGRGRKIYVNFDMDSFREGCGLKFELVDPSGRVLPGYSEEESVMCSNPGLFRQVRWKEHQGIDKDVLVSVELRVILVTNGDRTPYLDTCSSPLLYCIYIADENENLE
ncbi:hypothetical protein [Paenibacillus chungangensis]|uniref:Glycosyl hydrolase family 32 N-terminal domain-containing protein n=1 Tax=Paenibacillus chungangensis TaxID=696535 RepID=A0ABW3HUB5_9BACL